MQCSVRQIADGRKRRRWTPRMALIAWFLRESPSWAASADSATSRRPSSIPSRAQLPTPPEVTRDVVVSRVTDAVGRKASFRILLFTDEFRWRLSSFDALDATPDRPLFTSEMKAVLNSAEEIIAVGASSEELPAGASAAEGRLIEERRAGRRAERIAIWMREVLSRPVPVRKLNVGYHAPTRSCGPSHGVRSRFSTIPPINVAWSSSSCSSMNRRQHGPGAARGDGPRERARADLRGAADAILAVGGPGVHMGALMTNLNDVSSWLVSAASVAADLPLAMQIGWVVSAWLGGSAAPLVGARAGRPCGAADGRSAKAASSSGEEEGRSCARSFVWRRPSPGPWRSGPCLVRLDGLRVSLSQLSAKLEGR